MMEEAKKQVMETEVAIEKGEIDTKDTNARYLGQSVPCRFPPSPSSSSPSGWSEPTIDCLTN